ncbi:uncharacterized protein At1g66480-like [Typha latifolia]|uniref:uncharacterized protein At1g66480-like n=1 Tax=Typha latifolia TaxID=4733 RepID=UPI003C2DEFF1
MGNALLTSMRRAAKVMKLDGTTYRFKPPAKAMEALRDHPGYTILEADEVKRLGLQAKPLDPDAPLKPKKLYFLVELPKVPDQRAPRRAWSGSIQLGAKERLEGLMLSRRAASDLSAKSSVVAASEAGKDGEVRIKMRLPKAQVAKLMEESRDAAEAAEKIMELCVAAKRTPEAVAEPSVRAGRKEKRTRFVTLPDEIIA